MTDDLASTALAPGHTWGFLYAVPEADHPQEAGTLWSIYSSSYLFSLVGWFIDVSISYLQGSRDPWF